MEHFSTDVAIDLIKTALGAGSIKLQQAPAGTSEHSKEAAERDATYLLTLLRRLTKPAS
jgi:hypothetical protein